MVRRSGTGGQLQHRGVHSIHSVDQFRTILRNEQDRASRSQHEFSLLLFNTKSMGSGSAHFENFTNALIARIRSTDEVGWFGGECLGVILPYTPTAGAQRLAVDVCRACAATGVAPEWTVYTYPSDWFSNDNGNQRQYYFTDILPEWGAANNFQFSIVNFQFGTPTMPQSRPYRPLPTWKRAMDILVAGSSLILLSPFLLIISLIIKSVSRGPVFFKQQRVGYMGKPFTIWKFRTMKVDSDSSNHKEYITRLINGAAENGEAFGKPMTKLDDDPRIIPFGKILRKTCLDELPQLINVLRGQMSLVGPRPAIDYEVQVYSPWHYRRLDAVPGVTGLWQVNGKNRLTFNQMVRLDIKYLKEQSFWLDISILLKTPFAVFSQIKDSLQEKQRVAELVVENA